MEIACDVSNMEYASQRQGGKNAIANFSVNYFSYQ